MAELLPQERLQPSLLDRLTDASPQAREERREQRVLNLTQLRACVLRDVGWLLNTVHLQASQDLAGHGEVASSCVNFGIPDLAGSAAAGRDAEALERAVHKALLDFEPRILPKTLRVSIRMQREQMSRNALTIVIEGEMWAQPVPLSLHLETEVDLETGDVTIAEASR